MRVLYSASRCQHTYIALFINVAMHVGKYMQMVFLPHIDTIATVFKVPKHPTPQSFML